MTAPSKVSGAPRNAAHLRDVLKPRRAEARKFAELLRTLPDRLREIASVDLNIDALHDANVAGHAVNAVDSGTWHAVSTDVQGPD